MDANKTIGDLSKEFFDLALSPIRNVYLDAECLQDVDIGTLLSMLTTSIEYDYVINRLPIYNEVTDGTCVKHFPALDITTEQFNTAKEKLRRTCRLATCAPVTNLYHDLALFVDAISGHNKKCPAQVLQWTMHINHTNMGYTSQEQADLTTLLNLLDPGMVIKFHTSDIHELPEELLTSIDYFILDDIRQFMRPNSRILQMLAIDRVWEAKTILSVLRTDQEVDFSDEDMSEVFAKTKIILDLLCNFAFITKTIPLVNNEVRNE